MLILHANANRVLRMHRDKRLCSGVSLKRLNFLEELTWPDYRISLFPALASGEQDFRACFPLERADQQVYYCRGDARHVSEHNHRTRNPFRQSGNPAAERRRQPFGVSGIFNQLNIEAGERFAHLVSLESCHHDDTPHTAAEKLLGHVPHQRRSADISQKFVVAAEAARRTGCQKHGANRWMVIFAIRHLLVPVLNPHCFHNFGNDRESDLVWTNRPNIKTDRAVDAAEPGLLAAFLL